jgi:hypothetical protein
MAEWLTGVWADPIKISESIESYWWEKLSHNDQGGVYRLIAIENETGCTPKPLNRVAGRDPTGTLYIGATDRPIKNRLGNLVSAHRADYASKPHRLLSQPLTKLFPMDRLAFSCEYSATPWQREAELLMAYENEFGELPPNNGQRSIVDTSRHYSKEL